MSFTAPSTTRSLMVGIPSLRVLPPPLGISTLRCFPPSFVSPPPPVLARSIRAGEKLLVYVLKKLLPSLGLDGSKAHSIDPWRPIVGLGFSIRRLKSLHLAYVHIQTP